MESAGSLSSYTKVYLVMYNAGSVPQRAIFSSRETSPAPGLPPGRLMQRSHLEAHTAFSSCSFLTLRLRSHPRPLRPTVGNTVGLTTRFSGRYPMNLEASTHILAEHRRLPLARPLLCRV